MKTSAYLLDTAREHIEGKISIDEAEKRIQSYYEQRADRTGMESDIREADLVSTRITKLLGEKAFQFSPAEWLAIHRRLFEGVFPHAGQIRQYNITKKEWVLKGDTVTYASWNSIRDTLDYDFATEKQFSYEGLSVDASVKHLVKFASDIWQIHPFCEGNTRATAVFMIKYMKTFGFKVNNDAFEKNSWYFRNALVRANYNDLQNGIHATTRFLERFFGNLILGTDFELKNRYMHVDYVEADHSQSVNPEVHARINDSRCGKEGNFMPNTKWSELSPLQLGRYGEYYSKMEFASYGWDIYTSEVDDHGVDFVAKDVKTGEFFEIQVKSIRPGGYAFIYKDKISLDAHHLVCFLYFIDGELPKVYIIPATVWEKPNAMFVEHNYDKPGQTSKPEWGINYSNKNLFLLDKYKSEKFFVDQQKNGSLND